MSSSKNRKGNPREAQYGRFAIAVLATLREAVSRRTEEGMKKKEIADRIDMHPSSLTRLLNGRVPNITIKTISDVLWATEFEPVEFSADALEDLSPNYRPSHLCDLDAAPVEGGYVPAINLRVAIGEYQPSTLFKAITREHADAA